MKTTFKMLGPKDVWHPRVGAPRGNRNALKTGAHTKEVRNLRKQVTSVRRTMNLLIACAREELAGRRMHGRDSRGAAEDAEK